MTDERGGATAAPQEPRVLYERPSLVSVGNLHDLLLGASGGLCDGLIANPCSNKTDIGGCAPEQCGP
jgi:hypothetical protein